MAKVSRLIEDLGTLPEIIGGLGLSIAQAQKQLNADFVENVERLLDMIGKTLGTAGTTPDQATRDSIEKLLTALAPSRYQFSETTIEFCADISERMQKQTSAAVSFGKAVMLNAAFSKAFGYDYRAAARITSVLHAVQVGADMADDLLKRAEEVGKAPPSLPPATTLDTKLFEGVNGVYNALLGTPAPQTTVGQD